MTGAMDSEHAEPVAETESAEAGTLIDDAVGPAGTDRDAAAPNPNSEAAKYRMRLREAEARADAFAAERDHLLGRIDARDRAAVAAIAGRHLADGGDLALVHTGLDEFRDPETGDIDPAKVTEAATALALARPHWAKSRVRAPAPNRSQGAGGPPAGNPSWQEALQSR
jgi:hypothetical protein